MTQLLAVLVVMLGAVGVIAGIALLTAVVTMWAWNGSMPLLFAVPSVTFWVAFKLNLLAALLLKSTQTCTQK